MTYQNQAVRPVAIALPRILSLPLAVVRFNLFFQPTDKFIYGQRLTQQREYFLFGVVLLFLCHSH